MILVFTAERVLMATILIVEDDVFILEGAVLLAEDMGHNTLAATDIEEALLLLRFPQHIDALITDIRLKAAAFGGFELAHQAGKSRPNLPVLYTTGSYVTG